MSTDVKASDQAHEFGTAPESRTSSLALITNDGNMQRLQQLAAIMSSAKVTVPKHLQGSEGDCMAVIIQATNWGMNPFAVAQKTHLVNGVLGYEAQLVNAVVCGSGAIVGAFDYEYRGEGASLECRVGAVIRGRSEITWGEWLSSATVTTKNSPLWKTNPKQQMGYLQVKNWARAYAPGAILGVYSTDELEEIDITPPSRTRGKTDPQVKPVLPECTEEKFAKMCADVIDNDSGEISKMGWKSLVQSGSKTAEYLISMISTKMQLTDEQQKTINSWSPKGDTQ